MHNQANANLIERFYTAFAERDGAEMAACYAPHAHFSDPVFTDLDGRQAGAMWRMLTERGKDLKIDLVEHEADEAGGSARWIARYTFGETGRPVINEVCANFGIENGRIVDHHDDFSFYDWSKQALGPPGLLLGWTPVIRSAVRKKARSQLDRFISKNGDA